VYMLPAQKFVAVTPSSKVQKAILMFSVCKGNVHPVGLALVRRAREVEYMLDKNVAALAAEGMYRGNKFLCCADLNASN